MKSAYDIHYERTTNRLETQMLKYKDEENKEVDWEETQAARKRFFENISEACEEAELDVKIAKKRLELFEQDNKLLDHKLTFSFEQNSPEWLELQTEKLLRKFRKDVKTAENDLETLKGQLAATADVIAKTEEELTKEVSVDEE